MLLVSALLAAPLSGCGATDDADGGPVTVQVFGDGIELEGYRSVVAAYRRATGRDVRLVALADRDSHLAKLTTSFSGGHPPDAFLLSYRNFGPFVARSVIAPAGKAGSARGRTASADDPGDDLYDPVRRAFTVEGRLQCRPVAASPLVVYVNRALFRAARVPLPDDGWTYPAFFRRALELRAHTRKQAEARIHPLGIDPIVSRLATLIWSSGGELVDRPQNPGRFAFESPGSQRGLDRFLSLYREAFTPTERDVEAYPLAAQFADGRLAMFVATRREVATFRARRRLDWDVVRFPVAEARASALEADAICAARGARAERALDFATFAGGAQGQRLLARTGRFMPVLRSVAESGDFVAPGRRPANARAFLDAMSTARALPSSENWPRIEDSASLAFKQAFYAEVSVREAIERVEAETAGLF